MIENKEGHNMNIFSTLFKRKSIFMVSVIILLALSIGFSCIGCAAWASAQNQIANIDSGYTTIAMPLPIDGELIAQQWRNVGGLEKDDGNIYWADGTVTYGKGYVASVAAQAPQVERIENSGILSAGLVGSNGLASGSYDFSQYNEAFEFYNYSFCVLAVNCVNVTDISVDGYLEEGDIPTYYTGEVSYIADFEVSDCVSLMDSYGDLTGEHIRIWSAGGAPVLCNQDSSFPFEVGKTYLIRGFFRDLPMTLQWDYSAEEPTQILAPSPENEELGVVREFMFTAPGMEEYADLSAECYAVEGKIDTYYYTAHEDALPFYAEYTGDWQAFLETDEGKVWKDTIIPWTQVNQDSAAVVLTNNLNSIYNFNTGAASILEGRSFEQEEYTSGSDVCLISAAFAKHNGLSVGDTVTLDYYDTGMTQGEIHVEAVSSYNDYLYQRLTLTPESKVGIEKTYQIIGIYTAPEFSSGQYNFSADTIFVPKASVSGAEQYEEPDIAYLNALLLKNGTEEDFEAYMEAQGLPDNYEYVNMSFQDALPALEALADNATRLLLIGFAVFIFVAGISLYISLRQMMPVIHSVRLIGVRGKFVWKQAMSILNITVLTSVALGTILGASFFGSITEKILEATISFSWLPMLLCAGIELILLVVAAIAICWQASNRNLMQSGGK